VLQRVRALVKSAPPIDLTVDQFPRGPDATMQLRLLQTEYRLCKLALACFSARSRFGDGLEQGKKALLLARRLRVPSTEMQLLLRRVASLAADANDPKLA